MTTETVDPRESEAGKEGADFDRLAADTRQFVTFIAGNEVFAVDMAPVQEIIRVPEVVRVPLAPPTLDGLANLRGRVLPIISLRRVFGFPEQEYDDAARAVVVDVGQPLGFVVDRVATVVGVVPRQIESVDSISSTVDANLLSGLIKDVAGHAMIMVLDFGKLIEREFSQIAAVVRTQGRAGSVSFETEAEEASIDELQLVSFNVAEQEYAVAIDDVQEIVQIPEKIIHVPGAGSHVLGVMALRNRLLPLVSLCRMFGLDDRSLDEKSRIVVLSVGGASVGVTVDGVSEVLRVAKADVDAMPALLAKEQELTDISQICRLDDGKRLVSIITARNLFSRSAIKEVLNTVSDSERKSGQDEVDQEMTLEDDEQVVVFRLGKEEYGVPVASVQEIVRVPETLIRVPRAPECVEGVINLRSTVLPVLDLRLRLGLKPIERSDRQRIMVFMIAEVRTGFIVDQVAEVLKIPKTTIDVAPQFTTEQGRLLSRMANLEMQKRMIQLLDPSHLVEGQELAEISAVTKEVDDKALDS